MFESKRYTTQEGQFWKGLWFGRNTLFFYINVLIKENESYFRKI